MKKSVKDILCLFGIVSELPKAMFTLDVFFLSCQRLFYIIILWSFQKRPECFLKRYRRRLFLQLRASFQVEKSKTFLKKLFLTADQ